MIVHLDRDGALGDVVFDDAASAVTAGGAVRMPDLARRCAEAGHGGLSWMAGIPGSIGGAVRMNAGVRAGEVEGRHSLGSVSYTHLRAHETVLELVCRLLLVKKKKNKCAKW